MAELSFTALVEMYYRRLYQFALTLGGAEADAADLTQQTFLVWARKGHQLRDPEKVKAWLFTTLHREFLKGRRRESRFPSVELSQAEEEIPPFEAAIVEQMDASTIMASFQHVDELYRGPLALFYLEDHSYKQIAEILDIPLGTVQSRIARGRSQLQQILASSVGGRARRD